MGLAAGRQLVSQATRAAPMPSGRRAAVPCRAAVRKSSA